MSGRLLNFKQYIGGADNVITVELFPRSEKTYQYSFGLDTTGWTFTADYQSLLLDTVSYDRNTGLPNFTDTLVLGTFDNYTQIAQSSPLINVDGIAAGDIKFTIPGDTRYTGKIYPNALNNVVATVVAFQWDTNGDNGSKNTHRFLVLERWEPGVEAGDPTTNTTPAYTLLT